MYSSELFKGTVFRNAYFWFIQLRATTKCSPERRKKLSTFCGSFIQVVEVRQIFLLAVNDHRVGVVQHRHIINEAVKFLIEKNNIRIN